MEIKSTLTNKSGQAVTVLYRDIDSESDLKGREISGVHAYCFCKDKLVLVYSDKKGYWTPPGGGVESGESARDAVTREVKEETNMKVLKQRFVGFQEISEPGKITTQTRSVCIVEPYGPFLADPDDGEITKIELIDPKDYKKYFDWGEIGDHMMERVLQLKDQMDLEVNYVK
ncbi:MAG: NUDIX hydrolase [Candidatus Adlerbacteria bacterium]